MTAVGGEILGPPVDFAEGLFFMEAASKGRFFEEVFGGTGETLMTN
jgi:hypothetical protein